MFLTAISENGLEIWARDEISLEFKPKVEDAFEYHLLLIPINRYLRVDNKELKSSQLLQILTYVFDG